MNFQNTLTHTVFPFMFFSVHLSCQHHLKVKFQMHFAHPSSCIFEWCVEIIHTVIQPRKLRMSFFLVSTQMMPINDLMVEEDRNQFVPLIGRAQSEGSIDSSVTAKLITPQIIGHQPPWNIPVPFSAVLCTSILFTYFNLESILRENPQFNVITHGKSIIKSNWIAGNEQKGQQPDKHKKGIYKCTFSIILYISLVFIYKQISKIQDMIT